MRRFLAELYRRDRVLTVAGWGFVGLTAVMLAAAAVDHRAVLGINVWIKPIKFSVSIAIYLFTVAWLLGELDGPAWAKGLIRWGATTAMIFEIIGIAGQSLRGTSSHFNESTPLDGAIFTVMGLMILFNTLLEVILLAMFCKPALALLPAYLWGIRLGLVGSLLSAGVGILMVVHGAHTVGAPDGGPGLPFVNWSRDAGDLRAAHAEWLHALQVLMVAGYLLSRSTDPRTGVVALGTIAAVYLAIGGWLLWQAVEGRPVLNVAGRYPQIEERRSLPRLHIFHDAINPLGRAQDQAVAHQGRRGHAHVVVG